MLEEMRMVAALILSPALLVQTVSVGVRAGLPITDLFSVDQTRQTSTHRYTVGPTINIDIWRSAAIPDRRQSVQHSWGRV